MRPVSSIPTNHDVLRTRGDIESDRYSILTLRRLKLMWLHDPWLCKMRPDHVFVRFLYPGEIESGEKEGMAVADLVLLRCQRHAFDEAGAVGFE